MSRQHNNGRTATVEPKSGAAKADAGVPQSERREESLPQVRWEFLSIIVWDDDNKSNITGDLEDVEILNTLGLEGWELVCVVPLARTQVLEMAYPGNTRKLLAYLKRPVQ